LHEPREREPREPRIEKAPKTQKPSLAFPERSLDGCYRLLQTLKQRSSVKPMFDLVGSALDRENSCSEQMPGMLDLAGIECKLANCEYDCVEDCMREIDEFFDSVYRVFGASDIGRAAQRFAGEVKRAFAHAQPIAPSMGLDSLRKQLEKLANVPIRDLAGRPTLTPLPSPQGSIG
jgi:hypothetical protein